jgi:hypothetical protein
LRLGFDELETSHLHPCAVRREQTW